VRRSARVCIAVAVVVACISLAQAHDLALNVSKTVYRPGDVINVSARVTNTKEQAVNLSLEALLKDQRSKVAPTQIRFSLALAARESRRIELFLLPVDDSYYSGPYTVQASLIEGRFTVYQAEASFQIEGAPEDMTFEIILTRDPSHSKRTSVFVKNEKVYLDYSCSVQGPDIVARLTLPDGSMRDATRPGNLTARQAGSYTIQLNASKEGYRPVAILKSFAVLEQDPVLLESEKEASNLSLYVASERIQEGQMVELHGSVSPPHANANVTLSYVRQAATIAERRVVTDDDGRFSDSFEPAEPGVWLVSANWTEDSNHLGARSSQIEFTVEASIMKGELTWMLLGIIAIVLVAVAVGALRRR